ncbi:hypothetical protein BKA60DRAFT_83810 [Fusarium oxysporum]|jgi:hypothetical protein|nr:hypothetical protein BKA60DRAFT_83810 [Fusarium oxysporum]
MVLSVTSWSTHFRLGHRWGIESRKKEGDKQDRPNGKDAAGHSDSESESHEACAADHTTQRSQSYKSHRILAWMASFDLFCQPLAPLLLCLGCLWWWMVDRTTIEFLLLMCFLGLVSFLLFPAPPVTATATLWLF